MNSVNHTKSKNGTVTRNNTQLVTCTLAVTVIKITLPSLAMVRYLLPFTPVNSYPTRCRWGNLIFATTSGYIYLISYGVFLVFSVKQTVYENNGVGNSKRRNKERKRHLAILWLNHHLKKTNTRKGVAKSLSCGGTNFLKLGTKYSSFPLTVGYSI